MDAQSSNYSRTFQSTYPSNSHKYTHTHTHTLQQKYTQVPPITFHKHISPYRPSLSVSLALWIHSTCAVRQSARGHHVLCQRCNQLFTSVSKPVLGPALTAKANLTHTRQSHSCLDMHDFETYQQLTRQHLKCKHRYVHFKNVNLFLNVYMNYTLIVT